MSLKDYMLKDSKEEVYRFYLKINSNALDYERVSRNDMYLNILSLYKKDPEIILRLCSMEEIGILKKLLDGKIKKQDNGYIDYLLFQNLMSNYLILLENNEYYIPEDLINCVKMAMNLLNEEEYSMQDVVDSAVIGISRVYNVLPLEEAILLLKEYAIYYDLVKLKKQFKTNLKWKEKVGIIRYKKRDYLVSLEFPFYKDVIELRRNFKIAKYSLEELISFGKYKLNLFQEKILGFLNFLEIHLNPREINSLIDDLVFYSGFDINNESVLLNICDSIEELYQQIVDVIPEFPMWIYYGNNLKRLKENMILPDRNDPCICGSGKKFKNCCEKLFK